MYKIYIYVGTLSFILKLKYIIIEIKKYNYYTNLNLRKNIDF